MYAWGTIWFKTEYTENDAANNPIVKTILIEDMKEKESKWYTQSNLVSHIEEGMIVEEQK